MDPQGQDHPNRQCWPRQDTTQRSFNDDDVRAVSHELLIRDINHVNAIIGSDKERSGGKGDVSRRPRPVVRKQICGQVNKVPQHCGLLVAMLSDLLLHVSPQRTVPPVLPSSVDKWTQLLLDLQTGNEGRGHGECKSAEHHLLNDPYLTSLA